MSLLKVLSVLSLVAGTSAHAVTLKCGSFGNDLNQRSFTLKTEGARLTIKFDASGESSTANQSRLAGAVTKYTHFSNAIGSEVIEGQTVMLLNPSNTIAIPTNLNANPIVVRFYDSSNQSQWYTANCTSL